MKTLEKVGGKDMANSIPGYIYRIGVLIVAVIAYFYLPGLREFLHTGLGYLRSHDFEGLRYFILTYGLWAPMISIALMIMQSLIPVVPGIAITITNAWIFGWQQGAFYSWIGALLGAMLDFAIARWYGRLAVERFVNSKYLDVTDNFLKKYGVLAIIVTRLTPVVPFKVVSYGAGLTTMNLWNFIIATAIGQTPAIVIYSLLGHTITHSIRITFAIVSFVIVIGAVIYYYREAIRNYFSDKR